jgi:predicted SAM-dependent methyltransferase
LASFTPEQFRESEFAASSPRFDTLLLSHLLEHLQLTEAKALLNEYIPRLKPNGKIICVCPQEKGYASDKTHVIFYNFETITSLLSEMGCTLERSFSFPFPRWAGKLFIYNEFVVVGRLNRRNTT